MPSSRSPTCSFPPNSGGACVQPVPKPTAPLPFVGNAMPTRIVPPPPLPWPDWETLMQQALDEAALAQTKGEVPVGAVVVNAHGRIVGRGGNGCIAHADPTAHAEVLALRGAGKALGNYRLEGCVLVVTLEPCLMCAGAIAHARLAGVVYGAHDAKAGAVTSCYDAFDQPFLQHGVWHMGGVCEAQCSTLLQQFFAGKR